MRGEHHRLYVAVMSYQSLAPVSMRQLLRATPFASKAPMRMCTLNDLCLRYSCAASRRREKERTHAQPPSHHTCIIMHILAPHARRWFLCAPRARACTLLRCTEQPGCARIARAKKRPALLVRRTIAHMKHSLGALTGMKARARLLHEKYARNSPRKHSFFYEQPLPLRLWRELSAPLCQGV